MHGTGAVLCTGEGLICAVRGRGAVLCRGQGLFCAGDRGYVRGQELLYARPRAAMLTMYNCCPVDEIGGCFVYGTESVLCNRWGHICAWDRECYIQGLLYASDTDYSIQGTWV